MKLTVNEVRDLVKSNMGFQLAQEEVQESFAITLNCDEGTLYKAIDGIEKEYHLSYVRYTRDGVKAFFQMEQDSTVNAVYANCR